MEIVEQNTEKQNISRIAGIRKREVLAGLVLFLACGTIYSWSNYVQDMMNSTGWSSGELASVFSVNIAFFSVGTCLGGIFSKKFKMERLVFLGAAFLFTGYLISSFAESLVLMYPTYGILAGLGFGTTYISSIDVVQRWFPDKLGTISGILLMMYGFGGFVMGMVGTMLTENFGWRITFRIYAFLLAAVICLAGIVLRSPETEELDFIRNNYLIVGKDAGVKADKNGNRLWEEGIESGPKDNIRRPSYIIYFIWGMFVSAMWLGTISQAASFALAIGASVTVASMVAGTITICNGLGRLIAGVLLDRLKRTSVMRLIASVMLLSILILYFALNYEILALLAIASALMGLSYAGGATTHPVLIRKFWGSKYYSINFGIFNIGQIIAAVIGSGVGGMMIDHFGNYRIMMTYFLIMAVISFIVQGLVKRP